MQHNRRMGLPSATRPNGRGLRYTSDSSTSSDEMELLSACSSSSSASLIVHPRPADTPDYPNESVDVISQPSAYQPLRDQLESDDDSDDTVYDQADPDRTPRRIIRRRTNLREAIECCSTILARAEGDVVFDADLAGIGTRAHRVSLGRLAGGGWLGLSRKGKRPPVTPERSWSALLRRLRLLRDDGGAAKDPPVIRHCMGLLACLLDEVSVLTRDKSYLPNLSGQESRVVRSISHSDLALPAGFVLHENQLQLLETVPRSIFLRLVRFVLKHRTDAPMYLDLGHLPFEDDNVAMLESVDFKWAFDALGTDVTNVTHLDLSSNGFTSAHPCSVTCTLADRADPRPA
ncbi:hypothetical protein IAU60_001727 [Kwoniella sp. DSM 27419]